MITRREEMVLTSAEQEELANHEQVIEQGLKTFFKVGEALQIVRDKRLYRGQFPNFEQYCEKRWGLGRQYAYRVIDGVAVLQDLSPIGDIPLPTNEAQVRPLTLIKDAEERRRVWQQVLTIAPNGRITAALVRQVVQQRLPAQRDHSPSEPFRPATVQEAEKHVLVLAWEYAEAPLNLKRSLAKRLLDATEHLVLAKSQSEANIGSM